MYMKDPGKRHFRRLPMALKKKQVSVINFLIVFILGGTLTGFSISLVNFRIISKIPWVRNFFNLPKSNQFTNGYHSS